MTSKKDWKGNEHSVFVTLGASNHASGERETLDYYATESRAAELLLDIEPQLNNIYECCCGAGHLAKVFESRGLLGKATDLVDRGYGEHGVDLTKPFKWDGDIVTNPPYFKHQEIITNCIEAVPEGRYVCMFVKILFLESKGRKEFFKKYPPKTVWVSSSRLKCAKNGDFEAFSSSATAYCWITWQRGYTGETTIKWFN